MSTEFVVNTTQNNTGFTPIPEGDYAVHIVSVSPVIFNKEKEREECTLNLKVAEGPYKDRVIRFNNFYSTVVWKLSTLAHALGAAEGTKMTFEDVFKNIEGKSLIAKIIVREFNGKEKNEVVGYTPCDLPAIKVTGEKQTASKNAPAPKDVNEEELY